jgi:hypothetical protein
LLGLVLGLERALPLEVTSHPAHGVLEHFAHVAGSQLAERLPGELPLLLMIRPVEKDHVKVVFKRKSLEVVSIDRPVELR